MRETILVVDDDPNICELVKMYLEDEYNVEILHDGGNVLSKVREINPVLIILDIMLPVKDGLSVCEDIRSKYTIPVIMLTAKGEASDRIHGLEIGADDYITKPFSPKEVVARVRAVLRRSKTVRPAEKTIIYPGFFINADNHLVEVNQEALELTAKEFELLWLLAANPGRVFTRANLLDHVWGHDYYGDDRAVDSQVKRLRKKIESVPNAKSYIQTIWGVGYKFEVES